MVDTKNDLTRSKLSEEKNSIIFNSPCYSILKELRLSALPLEKEFPLAFSILVYRDVEQVYRLLRAIYRPHNYYCIHVDRKSPKVFYDLVKSWTKCLPNLIIPDGLDRINVNWGRMSTLTSDLTCMRLLSNASSTWKYFINLTGQEFPLKTNLEIVSILRSFKGANDVGIDFYIQSPFTVGYSEDSKSHRKFDLPPEGIKVYRGSAHVILHRKYTDYIVARKFIVRRLLHWLRDVNTADEKFHQILNNNPQLKIPSTPTRVNVSTGGTTRLKNWGSLPCQGEWLRGICLWGVKDIPYITSPDKGQIFVNKFVMNKNGDTYDVLERWYQNRTKAVYGANSLNMDMSIYKKEKSYEIFS